MNLSKSTLPATVQTAPANSKIINQHYLITKVLRDTLKGSVFKCFYLRGLFKSGVCILKSGKNGASIDSQGRDMKEKLRWQEQLHRKLQYLIPLPRLLDAFEYGNDYYIAISYVNGMSLSKKVHEVGRDFHKLLLEGNKKAIAVLSYLIEITQILDRLHQCGYVHRDVTIENFLITRWGKVYVIDLELAYSLNDGEPDPPHQLGTHGYMSPEQLIAQRPTIKEDVFSLGALLFKVFTGIDPNKTLGGPAEELQNKIRFFVKDAILADLIACCMLADPMQRPIVAEIRNVLELYKADIINQRKRPRFHSTSLFVTCDAISTSIQRAIDAMASPLMVKDGLWFSERMETERSQDSKMEIATYPAFSRGTAGVLYLLAVSRKMGYNISNHNEVITNSMDFIHNTLQTAFDHMPAGLHFGSAGIATSIASSINAQMTNKEFEYRQWIISLLQKDTTFLGFIHGITGIGLATLLCSDHLPPEDAKMKISVYVDRIKQQQQKNGSWQRKNSKGKPDVNLGFANGSAGIIWFLLECYDRFEDPETLRSAEQGLRFLIKIAQKRTNGNIDWNEKKENELNYWWCEGTPGIALAFLKAFKATQKQLYKEMAIRALKLHSLYTLDNNLTQCHGLAGLGEIYLEAYSTLKDEEWQERAAWIAQVLIKLKKEHPKYGPYWLTQKKIQPVADFMVGNAGIIHFLLRYLYPNKIKFPLLPT